jgi:hypothetical protein
MSRRITRLGSGTRTFIGNLFRIYIVTQGLQAGIVMR